MLVFPSKTNLGPVDLQAWQVILCDKPCIRRDRPSLLNFTVLLSFFLVGGGLRRRGFPEQGLLHSVLSSFIMEKGAAVQMGADSTHHSGIFNTIG